MKYGVIFPKEKPVYVVTGWNWYWISERPRLGMKVWLKHIDVFGTIETILNRSYQVWCVEILTVGNSDIKLDNQRSKFFNIDLYMPP